MLSSRFTTNKKANAYLQQHGTIIGKELHLKEGIKTTGEERESSEFYEKTAITRNSKGQIKRIINYRVPIVN